MNGFEERLTQAQDLLTLQPGVPAIESLDNDAAEAVNTNRSWVFGSSVVGTGIGPKVTAGEAQQGLSLKVYVAEKFPTNVISEAERVPPEVQLPGIAEPIITDVVAIGNLELQALTTRIRPAQPGYSSGLFTSGAGTLGCLVRKLNDPSGRVFILSNSHVLANSGRAATGTQIIQPGREDGGSPPSDLLAILAEAVPFDFNPGFNNLCDAAIAEVAAGDVVAAIPEIGVPADINTQLSRGMIVQKTGRTTGHTISTIRDTAFRTFLPYPKPDGTGTASAGFRDQVLCDYYTSKGDSGSLVCDMEGKAVGLHWCGTASTSIFSPINFVFSALGLEIFRE